MNPSPIGFTLGLVFAGIEFSFSDTTSIAEHTQPSWVPLFALLFLPALGAILPRLLWPRLLLCLLAGYFLFLLGQDAALGARAKSWAGSSWWFWILPVLFFLSFWALRRVKIHRALIVLCATGIYWAAVAQVPGHFQALAEDLSGFAFVLGLLAITPKLRTEAHSLTLPSISLVLLGLSFGTILQNETVARWSLDHGKLSSWVSSHLRQLKNPIIDSSTMKSSANDYFGSQFHRACAQERKKKFGRTKGVLFITIDALRFDMIGRKRKGLALTPFLDTLAKQAISLERAYSPAPISHWTLFSAFSGLLPGQIASFPDGLDAVPFICDRLEKYGVRTRASFSKRVHNARSRRLDFTREDFGFKQATLHALDPTIVEVIEAVMPQENDKRWFSYIHLMTPHAPYDSAPRELVQGTSNFDRYCGEVRLADRQVKEIVTAFRQANQMERTWIIISSDHGEAFGEHNAFFHGSNLYEEAIHVPLLICPPKLEQSKEVSTCVSLLDLAPTLDDLFDLPWVGRPGYAGRSWLPLVLGQSDLGRLDRAISESPAISLGRDKNLVAIVTPTEKLILDREHGIRWLFDLKLDPKEVRNIADEHPQHSARLMVRLQQSGAPPVQPDIFGRNMSMLEAFEDWSPREVLSLAIETFNSAPEALPLFTCWFVIHRTSKETREFIAHLESREGDVTGRPCLDLLKLRTDWDERALRGQLGRMTDPFLELAAYTLASEHRVFDLPKTSLAMRARETLPVTLARIRNDVGNLTGAKPNFDDVQHLVERGLKTKNALIRRLSYELIGASKHPGSVPHLLVAEEVSKSNDERIAIIKALIAFDDPAIAERFKRLAKENHGTIRDIVLQSWLNRAHIPKQGVQHFTPTFSDRFPRELELTVKHEAITVVLGVHASRPIKQTIEFSWNRDSREIIIDAQFERDFVRSFPVPRGISDIQVTLKDGDPLSIPLRLTSFLVIDNN